MNDPRAGDDRQPGCSKFRDLLPESVVVMEDEVTALGGALSSAEAALIVRAVDSRRSEFTAGRVLARRAMAALGLAHAEILADSDGVPAWPPAFTGCITHTRDCVAVAAAQRNAAEGLGIDMETVARFHRGLEHRILSQKEIGLHVAATSGAERQARTAVLFCAKEAWFKCQFPLTRRRLGLLDAEIEVEWATGRFVVLPCAGEQAEAGVPGCSSVHGGMARAAIVLPAGGLSAAARGAWQLPAAR